MNDDGNDNENYEETPVNIERFEYVLFGELNLSLDVEIVPEDTFASLGADSLDTLYIITAFEIEFDIEIDDNIACQITTVQHAFDYVEKCARCPEGLGLYVFVDYRTNPWGDYYN